MELKLSPEAEEMIRSRVESGKNASCEEVIDMALLTLISHEMGEADEEREMARFRLKMQEIEDRLEEEEFVDPDEMFARLRERDRSMRQAAA